jgi:hypothetical protein
MESNSGITRRDVLKRGAVAGGAVLWAVPVVQVIGMSASHAAAASGGGGGGGGGGGTTTPTPTPTGTTPTGGTPPTEVLPTELTQSPTVTPTVQGISFQQPPPPAVAPTATLPFTGAAVPVTGTVAVGAGLVATGVAAVAATRRRQQAAAASAGPASVDVAPPSEASDGELPPTA